MLVVIVLLYIKLCCDSRFCCRCNTVVCTVVGVILCGLYCCRCNTMLVVGDHGPTVDEAVNMNNRMNPVETTLVRVSHMMS